MADGDVLRRYVDASTMPEIFEVVKWTVRRHFGRERSGLMLGLANLGGGRGGLVGGFYQVAGNMIVMNSLPLKRIKETEPQLWKPYVFHILVHEYLHALGWLDERACRVAVSDLSTERFGDEHAVARLASGWGPFMDNLVYPVYGWSPPGGFDLEVVQGFDSSSTDYIQ